MLNAEFDIYQSYSYLFWIFKVLIDIQRFLTKNSKIIEQFSVVIFLYIICLSIFKFLLKVKNMKNNLDNRKFLYYTKKVCMI